MKIAFLIMAHGDWLHLNRLLTALDDEKHVFYVHIDKKVPKPSLCSTKAKLVFLDNINVWWGGWSVQAAVNILLKTAAKKGFDYYVLLSGTDYPIRPMSHLYKRLKEGGEYIELQRGFSPKKPESRIRYYYFDGGNRWNKKSLKTLLYFALEILQQKIKFIRKKKYPFETACFGSMWWALSHDCVEHILQFMQNNPDFVSFFKTSWCPDESFIHTIIGNSAFFPLCKGSLTYADWSEKRSSPAMINHGHVKHFVEIMNNDHNFKEHGPFFARKFDDNSTGLVKEIDAYLRQQP